MHRIPAQTATAALTNICRRSYSSGVPKYPSKVRAFPFALSQADAIVELGPYGSQAAAFTGFLGSLGASLFPGFGFKPLQPMRIQPVYLPAWFVDAEVEAKDATDNRKITAFLHNSYLPGFVFEPLSRISFNHWHDLTTEPIPFTDDMKRQFDNEVLCLPYVITPLSLPEAARSMSYTEAVIDEDRRFIPSSVKPNLFAAYPVLVPIYLAQYGFQTLAGEEASVTVILEAHSLNGRILCDENLERAEFPNTHIITRRGSSDFLSFAGVANVIQLRMVPSVASQLAGYLEDLISAPGAAEALANGALGEENAMRVPVEMDDLRVREYTAKETNHNRQWLAMSAQVAGAKLLVERLSQIPTAEEFFGLGSPPGKNIAAKALEQFFGFPREDSKPILEQLAEMDATRERAKPQWWKDWEGTNTSPVHT